MLVHGNRWAKAIVVPVTLSALRSAHRNDVGTNTAVINRVQRCLVIAWHKNWFVKSLDQPLVESANKPALFARRVNAAMPFVYDDVDLWILCRGDERLCL